jgi:putative flippase GtrA
MTLFARWLRFNAGGLYGFVIQLLVLTLLAKQLPLWLATGIAVEAAVLHNFVWHELFTWRERHVSHFRGVAARAVRFQLTNGLVSLVGNVLITTVLREHFGVPLVIANVTAIVACSLLNFAAGEWFVFRSKPKAYPEDRRVLFV